MPSSAADGRPARGVLAWPTAGGSSCPATSSSSATTRGASWSTSTAAATATTSPAGWRRPRWRGATTTYGYDDRGLLATERSADGRPHLPLRRRRRADARSPTRTASRSASSTTPPGAARVEVGSRRQAGHLRLGRARSAHRRRPDRPDGTTHRATGSSTTRSGGRRGSTASRSSGTAPPPAACSASATSGTSGGATACSSPPTPTPGGTAGSSGDPWGDDGGTGVRLGYRGELALDNLLFLGSRVYDTRTRSFLSRDPLPSVPGTLAFAGVYTYAWCDPVNLVDPSGRRPLSDDEYAAFREQASKGFFRKVCEAMAEDPWGYLAKAAIVVGGAIVMGVAVATLGPVGVILAGAAVGAPQRRPQHRHRRRRLGRHRPLRAHRRGLRRRQRRPRPGSSRPPRPPRWASVPWPTPGSPPCRSTRWPRAGGGRLLPLGRRRPHGLGQGASSTGPWGPSAGRSGARWSSGSTSPARSTTGCGAA